LDYDRHGKRYIALGAPYNFLPIKERHFLIQ
jgi:hypothetical protein